MRNNFKDIYYMLSCSSFTSDSHWFLIQEHFHYQSVVTTDTRLNQSVQIKASLCTFYYNRLFHDVVITVCVMSHPTLSSAYSCYNVWGLMHHNWRNQITFSSSRDPLWYLSFLLVPVSSGDIYSIFFSLSLSWLMA